MFFELDFLEALIPSDPRVSVVAEAKLRRDDNPSSLFTGYPPSNMAFRYQVLPDKTQLVLNSGAGTDYQDLGFSSFNSSARSSITQFIQWSAANYPANHYVLVLGDHGGSWFPGGKLSSEIIEDDANDWVMNDSDVVQAIAASGVHVDLLDLDACLMGTVEVADEFKGTCDYLVFSENTIYGFTWIGIGNLYNQPTMTSQQLAQACVSDYHDFWVDPSNPFAPVKEALTLSAVRSSSVPAVASALGTLRSQLVTNMSTEKPNLQSAAAGSHEMPPSPETYLGQVDMYAFLESYKAKTSNSAVKTAIGAVESALSSAVVAHTHVNGTGESLASEGGLVLYVPTSQSEFNVMDGISYGAHYRNTLPFNQTTHWYDVLSGMWGGGGSVPAPPTNVAASDGLYTNAIEITWDASAGATGYKVFRSTSSSATYTQVGTSTTTTYSDFVPDYKTYWYKIKAYNANGDSSFSSADFGYVTPFAVELTWGSVGSDLDLWIVEPGPNSASCSWGTPLDGLFSLDSSKSGLADEFYVALPTAASGQYDIWVNYYNSISTTSTYATVVVTLYDGAHQFGPQLMSATSPNNTAMGAGWWYVASITQP
jgi:hypothetical protein